jgi:glutaredoxin
MMMKDSNKYLMIIGVVVLALVASITTYWVLNRDEEAIDTTTPVVESNDVESSIEDENPDIRSIPSYELVIFHNGTGPMCVEAIDFFQEKDIKYTEYLTTDENFDVKLSEYKSQFGGESEGVSTTFGYYPVIFINSKAYSGFNKDVEDEILKEIYANM